VSDPTIPAPTRIEPRPSELTLPFWNATREHKLLVQWCHDCDAGIHYPRVICPRCLGSDLGWRTATGDATVHAVSVQYSPGNPLMADRVPYAVALVDLPEGIRLMTNIVTDTPESIRVGDHVRIAWEPLSDGRNLPVFAPADPDDR